MEFNSYKAVIFDMDETLLTLDVDWANAKQECANFIADKYKTEIDFTRFAKGFNEVAEQLGKQAFKECSEIMDSFEKDGIEELTANERAIEIFQQAKNEGKIMIIYTGNSRRSAEAALKKVGLLQLVDFSITRDEVAKVKPDPDGLLQIMEHFDLKAGDLVFIGNSPSDEGAAKSQGVRFIHVSSL